MQAALQGGFERFFALLEEVVKNQERQKRWERSYRAGLGALMLRCTRHMPLPVPSGTQCHQRIGSEDKGIRRGSGVCEIQLHGLNEIEL